MVACRGSGGCSVDLELAECSSFTFYKEKQWYAGHLQPPAQHAATGAACGAAGQTGPALIPRSNEGIA